MTLADQLPRYASKYVRPRTSGSVDIYQVGGGGVVSPLIFETLGAVAEKVDANLRMAG